MPGPRLPAALLVCIAALAGAGCGSSSTSTSSVVPNALSTSSGCASATSACSVGTAASQPTPPPACTNPGSGRTDDFHQQVALTRQSDGLELGDILAGAGPQAKAGQLVTVAYSGWLADGTLFDSSRKAGGQPFAYQLGSGNAIAGFDEAIATMHVGGVRRAVIPPALAYGPSGQGPIPPNATLTFDIELLCAA